MSRYLSTIFCDDIRQEVGGKVSLIGVYNNVMFVPQFPITLPKLWLMTTFVIPYGKPPKSMKICVSKNNDALAELEATREFLDQLAKERDPMVPPPEESQRVITTQAHVCFTDLKIDGPCTIRTMAVTDTGDVRGLGLQIQQQPLATPA